MCGLVSAAVRKTLHQFGLLSFVGRIEFFCGKTALVYTDSNLVEKEFPHLIIRAPLKMIRPDSSLWGTAADELRRFSDALVEVLRSDLPPEYHDRIVESPRVVPDGGNYSLVAIIMR